VKISVLGRPGVAFTTAAFDELAGETKRADADEAIRLLYVAATRAMDRLIVSVHHKPAGGQNRTHAQRLYEQCEALGVPRRDRVAGTVAGTLFQLEEGAGPPPRAIGVEERAARLADLERVLEQAARPWAVAPTAIGGHDGDDDDSAAADVQLDPDGADPEPIVARRGGTAVGRAVHGVLETVPLDGTAPVDGGQVEALARAVVVAEGLPDDAVATVVELATSALASDALAAARASGRAWREVPVVAPVGDRMIEGYVDLLYEAPDGTLVVVDWKTDRARTPAEIDAALGRYRLQGAGYALALGTATGKQVSKVQFVFCRAGGQPAVEREITDLEDAIEDARRLLV
jgi:ATP-dependent helicase/nuclease subunit A